MPPFNLRVVQEVRTAIQDFSDHILRHSEMGSIVLYPHDMQLFMYFTFFINRSTINHHNVIEGM